MQMSVTSGAYTRLHLWHHDSMHSWLSATAVILLAAPSPARRQQGRGEAAASEGVDETLERLPSLLLIWAPDSSKRSSHHVGRTVSHEGCQEAAPHVQVRRQGQQKEGEGGKGVSTICLVCIPTTSHLALGIFAIPLSILLTLLQHCPARFYSSCLCLDGRGIPSCVLLSSALQ